ncbi:alpha/beta hydrolase-fold protein [Embleya hyalina]|uniref:alpha/beta hydrolase-fold protein n=1 Tax=Embleya hyalina TaxID=516124 RepID=UPI000F83BC69|nr:alpha/beta hydrolase-fold protein [Embleya hyalina]
MTRTLKGLLIAVTLGAVVVLVLRARKSRDAVSIAGPEGEPGPRPAELPPAGPHVSVRERAMAPAREVAPVRESVRDVGSASAVASGPEVAAASAVASTSVGRDAGAAGTTPQRAEAPPPFAPVGPASSAPAGSPRHEPVRPARTEAAPTVPAPRRRRRGVRSPLGVGLLAVTVIAAGVGGTFAYRNMSHDDAQNVAATGAAPSVEPVATSGQPKAAPQKFTKVGTKSGGTLNRMTVTGRQSAVTADVWVWLPPGYDTPANQGRNYPVLVAQSSLPGVESNSFVDDSSAFLSKLAAGIESGTVPPYIVVAPELMPYSKQDVEAGLTTAKDTECSDIPKGPKMATFHNEDVREAVLTTYRASSDRASWALIGDGSGGLCAVKYALQYPQYYASAVSLSGRTTLKSALWGGESAVRTANDPVRLLDARPDVAIMLSGHPGTTGSDFAAKAKAPTTVKAVAGAGGASTDTTRQLPDALTFLGRNTRNPAA